jgi:hypothetical protein
MQSLKAKLLLGLLAAAACFTPQWVLAQDTPPLVEMWVMVPKAGHSQELTEALKKHMAFRSEQGDPRNWNTYTPLLGDELDRVAVRSCCHNWADIDAYAEWSRAQPAVGAHFNEHVAPHVESYGHYFEEIDWAGSHWNDKASAYKYFAVTEFALKAGHAAEFHAARDKMSQIAINQGWANDERSWIWSTTIGGKPRVSVVVPHENFASMADTGEGFMDFLARNLGSQEAAAELLKQFSAATWGSDYQVWVHRDELSMASSD